jgi:hypothetical protein
MNRESLPKVIILPLLLILGLGIFLHVRKPPAVHAIKDNVESWHWETAGKTVTLSKYLSNINPHDAAAETLVLTLHTGAQTLRILPEPLFAVQNQNSISIWKFERIKDNTWANQITYNFKNEAQRDKFARHQLEKQIEKIKNKKIRTPS